MYQKIKKSPQAVAQLFPPILVGGGDLMVDTIFGERVAPEMINVGFTLKKVNRSIRTQQKMKI